MTTATTDRDTSLAADFWAQLDSEVLDCLACGRAVTPEEVGDKLGVSAAAAASLLSMLALDGRVRILSAELRPASGRE